MILLWRTQGGATQRGTPLYRMVHHMPLWGLWGLTLTCSNNIWLTKMVFSCLAIWRARNVKRQPTWAGWRMKITWKHSKSFRIKNMIAFIFKILFINDISSIKDCVCLERRKWTYREANTLHHDLEQYVHYPLPGLHGTMENVDKNTYEWMMN